MRSIKGMSFVELVMAMGLAVVLAYGYSTFETINKNTKKTSDEVQYLIEKSAADRVIQSDLYSSLHSYNNILMKDDKGKVFYDYRPYPLCVKNCNRTMTMKIEANELKSKPFYILASNRKRSDPIQIDIARAYAKKVYIGLNGNEGLEDLSWNKEINPTSPWLAENFIVIYSVFYPTEIGRNTFNNFTRNYFYLGKVRSDAKDLDFLPVVDEGNIIVRDFDPIDNNKKISSTDDFLKSILGPGSINVRAPIYMEEVQILKYYLERDDVNSSIF
jgi:hypothetical protein